MSASRLAASEDGPSVSGVADFPKSNADRVRVQETAMMPPLRLLRSVCVDDDIDFLSVLRRHLMNLGIAFTGATNAVLGMRAVHRERPDFVITDYRMPNAHGTFLLRCLRHDAELSSTPVIVVTGVNIRSQLDGNHSLTVEQQLRRLGAQSILRKPLNVHALTAAVQKCLTFTAAAHGNNERASGDGSSC
jgi:CheY-like chemotaxis protein